MAHTCHAIGCTEDCPPRMFMCRPHWARLPKSYQELIWQHYRPGQEITKTPSRLYLEAANAARQWLGRAEGLIKDQPDLFEAPSRSQRGRPGKRERDAARRFKA